MTLKTRSFPWWFLRWYSLNLQGRSRSGNDSERRATGNYIHLPLWTLIHANHSNKNIGSLQLNINTWTFLPFSNVDMYLDDRDESSIKRMLLRHSECNRPLWGSPILNFVPRLVIYCAASFSKTSLFSITLVSRYQQVNYHHFFLVSKFTSKSADTTALEFNSCFETCR